ncbi:MAG: ATP-grasp domain-containing protein [Pseudanabaenaceae cyanobacterium SKYGB_i_bin29]|nr:ATP-grasp domain-containing protein [Pseudanabaenaceae cyanobacterium SKYG29]MDW8421183.1 ATP-grasp domain-containing protein [Pseudanabaenaceae cyanobacterium SKYGB_i_bin29]
MKILQLVGSPVSNFYEKLSRLYAKDAIEALGQNDRYEFLIAYVTKEGWRFPVSLAQADIDRAAILSLASAIARLEQERVDVALPQMFCLPGMTVYRSLLEVLQIPYIGNTGSLMALAADKAKTKAIVSSVGVQVPRGEILCKHQQPSLSPPVVVKPVDADNSIGVSLVRQESEYSKALAVAWRESDRVLVEEFIPGREVRCGVLDLGDGLICLPLEEYPIDPDYPIRTVESKIRATETGELYLTAKDPSKAWIVHPQDDCMTLKVWEVAKLCHRALGCRHYSLFDLRINPGGEIYFLEAGLYCSFSPKSVIVTMARSAGIDLGDLFAKMLTTARRGYASNSPGMSGGS